MTDLRIVEVVSDSPPLAEFDYELIADPVDRDWAESAAGFITFGLGQAVVKVLEAGNLLIEAKQRLTHGEYLPWVEQACGMKERYAQKLVQAAQWMSNAAHVAGLEGITDTATLFLLSADATSEEVRQWALERCAAGSPPSRKEVQDRKRNSSETGRQRTVIDDAFKAFKISEEARSLAASALRITTRQLMDDLGVDEPPKGRRHITDAATYIKDKDDWVKFPMQQAVDVSPAPTRTQVELFGGESPIEEVVSLTEGAARLGKKVESFRVCLAPSKIKQRGNPKGNGWIAIPHSEKGKCLLKRISS